MMKDMVSSILGKDDFKLSDEVIANNMMMALESGSTAYHVAALKTATPEVRRMFADFMTQQMTAHEGITEILVKNKWINPYDPPEQSVARAVERAQWVTSADS